MFNAISSNIQGINHQDPIFKINLTNVMHAFIVTNRLESTGFSVCEAVGSGITSAQIRAGDQDWTSMVLFVPKSQKVHDQVLVNAMKELKWNEKGKVADYGFVAGLVSTFTDKGKIISQSNEQTIASEMADLIISRSIRNNKGDPKAAICSQVAMRVLRSSVLISAIPKNKIAKYALLNRQDLETKLLKNLRKETSFVGRAYKSSELLQVNAEIDTLPYELYRHLIKESDIISRNSIPPL